MVVAGFNNVIKVKIHNTAINLNSMLLNKTGATKIRHKHRLLKKVAVLEQ